ncbi:MAG TPA: hypothetical protein PLF41_10890 [Anaerolineales bacterium]|nr:hypothetical protein [Anaerolineales bacterium]
MTGVLAMFTNWLTSLQRIRLSPSMNGPTIVHRPSSTASQNERPISSPLFPFQNRNHPPTDPLLAQSRNVPFRQS